MAESLKAQLAKLYPALAPPSPQPEKHPPYSTLDIPASYAKFCAELAGRRFADPCGRHVWIFEENFPKLLNLKLKKTGANAKASRVLESLRSNAFDASIFTFEKDRLRTLFWIPDIICGCHSVHPNGHRKIEGEEVYLKVYDKEGEPIKILFTTKDRSARRIITTSFLTSFGRLPKFIRMPAVWAKK